MKYWNIFEVLTKQRNFMLINGERGIGKTYTAQKWILDKCIKRNKEFIYITRTINEKTDNVFQKAHEKVERNEFPDNEFKWSIDTLRIDDETRGWCIALSESQKIKKRSFPSVDYILFDEYMLEDASRSSYVSGWSEPDLLLSIYQTVDRDEDRVKCFMLGNNTSFYNPYHLHPAFNIRPVKPGGIWMSKNVLYQYAVATSDVKDKKAKSKFGEMITGTKYGDYANDGKYIEDEESFIGQHDGKSIYQFTIIINGVSFGVYNAPHKGYVYISEKTDPSNPFIYALTLEDHRENTLLTKAQTPYIKWLSRAIKAGAVRYESMLIKKMCEKVLYTLT